MEEEWIVRVEGKEYGPVNIDVLREWKLEGRLIRTNEVRRPNDERWIQAGELPEVFADPESGPPVVAPPPFLPAPEFEKARTWRQILAETFRIYRRGFGRFMLLGLLTSVPMFIFQWTFPRLPLSEIIGGSSPPTAIPPLSPFTLIMLVVVILLWPISTAGFQFVADDILHGRDNSFASQFSVTMRYWGRTLTTALIVYCSYFFWTFLPYTAMLAFSKSGNLAVAFLGVLFVGGFMIYIVARLFINFLFWQQTVTLGGHPPLLALRESKELARSEREAPLLERPLYRGAIIASVWLLILAVLTYGVEVPFVMVRLMSAENIEEATALMRKMTEAQTPDALMLAAAIGGAIINLLLTPLLSAAFVVLYHDARARSGRVNEGEIRSE